MSIPDFGMSRIEVQGIALECRFIAPGLTMQDLTNIFETASKSKGVNDLSGNPSDWSDVRGVKAVTEAILNAVYMTTTPTPPPQADREAVREAVTAMKATIDELQRAVDHLKPPRHGLYPRNVMYSAIGTLTAAIAKLEDPS